MYIIITKNLYLIKFNSSPVKLWSKVTTEYCALGSTHSIVNEFPIWFQSEMFFILCGEKQLKVFKIRYKCFDLILILNMEEKYPKSIDFMELKKESYQIQRTTELVAI